jgi:ATP-dependent exoDNAse (exonuclease V) beta subunit
MSKPEAGPIPFLPTAPPDAEERRRALDPNRSFLVQAPAGSGKTQLLTQRFLRLLGQAERPDEIVAITFTNAAAAEMRQRILGELEKAAAFASDAARPEDPESLPALALRAMDRSRRLGWEILDQPNQLRITTIDAFCRGLALQSPLSWGLLSGLGGRLDPADAPKELYRQAAKRTLGLLDGPDTAARRSVEALMRWRDNNWTDLETLIVEMLGVRNRWYQEFVFLPDGDWDALRTRLERPFLRAAHGCMACVDEILDRLPESREFALELARFACGNGGKSVPLGLAERAEMPHSRHLKGDPAGLEDGVSALRELANFLMTKDGGWRKKGGVNVNHGFPPTPAGKAAKDRFVDYLESLAIEAELEAALGVFQSPVPLRYEDAEWSLIRDCFSVLRAAYAELQVVFAETGSVDFTEIAQIALRILAPENGFPSDIAMREADSIRHLLIDEFQDTSRNQHLLLARLIGAWPDREGRSCFCVGDPMQSIYGFRDAEVELFERVKTQGLELPSDISALDAEPFPLEFVQLKANFRTAPSLVNDLNEHFTNVFAENDGSGVEFSSAAPARISPSTARTELHLAFTRSGADAFGSASGEPEQTRASQLAELVELVRGRLAAEQGKSRFRIAVLAKNRKSLVAIAEALREGGIGFRAIELVKLNERPEVLDALALARALLNPVDRVAWLGVLRAPWCGLSLAELHLLTSNDEAEIVATSIPTLLSERLPTLYQQGILEKRAFESAARVARVVTRAIAERTAAAEMALGTWLESVWKALGGEATVNAEQRENLRVLWAALDGLPEGELDLQGPGLKAALERLYALPDPAASAEFGVQLMTIHKSKGLEFEMVIVPDLEATGKTHDRSLMSWLERGLPGSQEDQDGALTEFLIAPIQAKGKDASAAKAWVDRVKREREKQELRRLLYVAATRAREELHLFARPRFSEKFVDGKIERQLGKPKSLLATAWPAFGELSESRFTEWCCELTEAAGEIPALAASATPANSNLVTMPVPVPASAPTPAIVKPTMLRRLPEGFVEPQMLRSDTPANDRVSSELFTRTEGGLESRLLGKAIHSLLEHVSHLRVNHDPQQAAEAAAAMLPSVIAAMRSDGLPLQQAKKLAAEALAVARQAAVHPEGAWILAPYPTAASESRWSGIFGGEQRNLRPDRVFFASHPEESGNPVWWIIDYKSSEASAADLADDSSMRTFFEERRTLYAGQLAAYAHLLRHLKADAALPIRTGLYYPRLNCVQKLDWWEA